MPAKCATSVAYLALSQSWLGRYDVVARPSMENVTVTTYTPILKASQKIAFLQELREHLMLSPEEYRQLVKHVLKKHIEERARLAELERKAA
jgi:hypothetical protein